MKRALTFSSCLVLAAAFAAANEPAAPKSAVAPAAAPAADSRPPGEQLYRRHCLTCHQADGWGVPNMQPPIVGGSWVKGDAKALALFVMTGGFDSAERKDSAVSNVMPPFRQLSDEDLAGILTYIRAKFGEGAPAVSAADVAAARASGQ
jgi:mono/diheme cytochrome c family protein